jgi:hypothetical protein
LIVDKGEPKAGKRDSSVVYQPVAFPVALVRLLQSSDVRDPGTGLNKRRPQLLSTVKMHSCWDWLRQAKRRGFLGVLGL